MNAFTPPLNLPKRKVKGLIKVFGGLSVPWYFTTAVVKEGTPMKLDLNTQDKADVAAPGVADNLNVIGLALQETYDESAFGQLKGYHFANDTRQRLDGNPIGMLMGAGWAMTNNYVGTVSYGKIAAIAPSGLMKDGSAAPSGDKLPIWFEGAGTNGDTMVRIRFDIPVAR
jgi:hypothetical protein